MIHRTFSSTPSCSLPALALVVVAGTFVVGCSDDDNPSSGGASQGNECSWGDGCGSGKCTVENIEQAQPRCRSIWDNPDVIGDPCETGGDNDGDSCEEGALCVNNVCIEICQANRCSQTHVADTCYTYPSGAPLCTTECNPLLNNCWDGWQCVNDVPIPTNRFICAADTNSIDNSFGGACSTSIMCQPGFACMNALAVGFDFCDGNLTECCTALCDSNDSSFQCPGLQSCLPVFLGGMTPPGFDPDLGVCASF